MGEVHTALHSISLEEAIMEQYGEEAPKCMTKGQSQSMGSSLCLLCGSLMVGTNLLTTYHVRPLGAMGGHTGVCLAIPYHL